MAQKERILVIDDDAYIRNACADFLRSEGYEVNTAENGEEGIKILLKATYNLVITDLKMPGIDGLEVLKKAKEMSPKTDVIIITAYGTIENAVEAMKQGAYDYITKNFDILELELIVMRCFEKQRLSKQVSELKEVINLYEASKAMSTLMALDDLLSIILHLICDTLAADSGSIMLYNTGDKELTVRSAVGPGKDALTGRKITLSGELPDFNVTGNDLVFVHGMLKGDPRFADIEDLHNARLSMTVPLERKGNLLGVINLKRKENAPKFTKRDEYLLSIFVAEASVSIENTYLFNSLEKEKKELNAIFENMADGAITIDSEFRFIRVNQAAETLLGVSVQDCLGKNLIEVLHDFVPSISWDMITVHSERVIQFELTRTKGKTLYLGIVVTKIFSQGGAPIGYIWVLRDITERKREGKHKNDFLSLISHKLKTPLTSIIGYTSILAERFKTTDERTSQALKSIERQGDFLNELVDSLVRFTLLDSEFMQLHLKRINMLDLLEICTRGLSDLALQTNTEIHVDEQMKNLPEVYVDHVKIVEVVENIIENAIKFNNSAKKTVHIAASVIEDGFVQVNLKDNGVGIPSEEHRNIFTKFYQIDEYSTGQIRGMGLGLALVKRIVELHGGRVWVKSKVGEGTVVSFTLPVYTPK